jgi:transitional endoplasmic reticulum ATPase
MSNTLKDAVKAASVAQIVYHGEQVTLPVGMGIDAAIDLLQRRKAYEGEKVVMRESFDVFPWDGAHALDAVLTRKYGWSPAQASPGMFGPTPPQLMAIEVAPGVKKNIAWGDFGLPNVSGVVKTSYTHREGRIVFEVIAQILRKDEATIKDLFDAVRKETETNSIYRGKAIKIRFRDESGEKLQMPEPRFLNTEDVDESLLVYPDSVQRAIHTNLFTPITRVHDCIANNIPVKRGVLLGGTFGTGKTLAAKVASKLAVRAGITYVYVPRADELSDAIEFAKQYQSPACVVFCEDIDRVASGERSVAMDDVLNIIDGIDTKSANIIVVLTTNNLPSINPAMLRPGRLDAVIEVLAPDQKAVERLLRLYGGKTISEGADLSKAGALLAGNIPAVIAEVVKRAKLAQLALQKTGTAVEEITEDALIDAAETMSAQVNLLRKCAEEEHAVKEPTLHDVMQGIVAKSLAKTNDKIDAVHREVA